MVAEQQSQCSNGTLLRAGVRLPQVCSWHETGGVQSSNLGHAVETQFGRGPAMQAAFSVHESVLQAAAAYTSRQQKQHLP